MKTTEFEKTLSYDLSQSIEKHPEKWKKSTWGLQRIDKVELNISTNGISVKKPLEYIFENKQIEQSLFKIANELYTKLLIQHEDVQYNKILYSLENHPEEWKPSVWGIENDPNNDFYGKLELKITNYGSKLSVYKPTALEFKNVQYAKHLYKIASKLLEEKVKEEKKTKLQDTIIKLSVDLNLNTRKNKLEKLKGVSNNVIEEVKEIKEIKEVEKPKNISLLQKFLNWFK